MSEEYCEMIDRNTSVSLYEQLQDIIRSWIVSGKLKPGDQLMPEMELAEQFQVSRTTVRKAIDSLVKDALLVRRVGKGTYVLPSKIAYSPSTFVSFSTTIQKYGYEIETKMLELRICNPDPEIGELLRLPKGEKAVYISRLRLVDGLPMALHEDYFPYEKYYPIMGEDLIHVPMNKILFQRFGVRVQDTNDTISAVIAGDKMKKLFCLKKETPLLIIQGSGFDEEGEPVRYTRGTYRGDYFEFIIDLNRSFVFKNAPSEA